MILLIRKHPSSIGPTYLRPKNAEYLDKLDRSEVIPASLESAYKNRVVKADLLDETHHKCAYCESKVRHVYAGDVEHIKPKAHFPRLRLEYDNLTYACGQCNVAKGDFYDPAQPLLNPFATDPAEQLYGYGSFIIARPGSGQAKTAEVVIKLNRPELLERRDARLAQVRMLADLYAHMPDGVAKDAVKEQLAMEKLPEAEYSFAVSELFRCMRLDI